MIYLFIGDDVKNKIKSYENLLSKLADLPLYAINRNNFDSTMIESFYSGANLFDPKSVILFSNILEDNNTSFILENLENFQKSENIFIFNEGKLLKVTLDKFTKVGSQINIFELKKEQKEKFNNFLLADAFSMRDKIKLWLYYRQAVDIGVSLEELSGVLFWKVKDMILNKRFLKYKEEELKNINFKLSTLLAEARKEGKDDEAIFEKFILEVV